MVMPSANIGRRIEAEEETNLILLRLVEYLGHANPFISNLAYEEVCLAMNYGLPRTNESCLVSETFLA